MPATILITKYLNSSAELTDGREARSCARSPSKAAMTLGLLGLVVALVLVAFRPAYADSGWNTIDAKAANPPQIWEWVPNSRHGSLSAIAQLSPSVMGS
jgi:hypothetical protein